MSPPASLCPNCDNQTLQEVVVGHNYHTRWVCMYLKSKYPAMTECSDFHPRMYYDEARHVTDHP